MKRIAVISSDTTLSRAVALALECSAAAAGRVEVVTAAAADAMGDGLTERCDIVVVVGAAGFVSGQLSARKMRRRGERRPEIFVISWQHNEQTVTGLIECGVDQYMTLPLSLRRLCRKIVNSD